MDNIENVIRVKTWIVSGYMENISKIKTEIYRELVEKMIDGGECSDEELYELIEERVFEKSHSTYISQNDKEILVRGIFN